MDGEPWRKRKAELGRHGGEERTLDVPIAVEKGVNLPEPAEGAGQPKQPPVEIKARIAERVPRLLQEVVDAASHFARRTEFVIRAGLELAIDDASPAGKRGAMRSAVRPGIFITRGWVNEANNSRWRSRGSVKIACRRAGFTTMSVRSDVHRADMVRRSLRRRGLANLRMSSRSVSLAWPWAGDR